LLLVVAHFSFLRTLSTSWLQFRPEALGRETGVASSAREEQQAEGEDDWQKDEDAHAGESMVLEGQPRRQEK